jgi:hypothetical protein
MRHAVTLSALILALLCAPTSEARPRAHKAAARSMRARLSQAFQRLLPRRTLAKCSKATTRLQKGKTTKRARRGTFRRNVKAKVLRLRRKLADEWRWQRKKDWKLMETHATDYVGMNASSLNPYFWNVWKDKRTGRTRITTDY